MGLGTKIVLIMMSITIVLMFSGYNNLPLTSGLIGMNYNNSTNETLGTLTIQNNNTLGVLQNNNTLVASTPLFGFFNYLGLVYDTILILVSVFFAPVTTLLNIGAPNVIVAMVGVTWVMLYILAIMMFVRGWDF